MCKIIELCKYRKSERQNNTNTKRINRPLWFYELNEGVRNLALKNQDIIIASVKENLLDNYYSKLNELHITQGEYSMDSFLSSALDLSNPFSVPHGVQFKRNTHLSMISENDWYNITDIIIRYSINHFFHILDLPEPFDLVRDYSWTSIVVDVPNMLNE